MSYQQQREPQAKPTFPRHFADALDQAGLKPTDVFHRGGIRPERLRQLGLVEGLPVSLAEASATGKLLPVRPDFRTRPTTEQAPAPPSYPPRRLSPSQRAPFAMPHASKRKVFLRMPGRSMPL